MEETLGKRISSRRKALGLTQDALAEQLSITAQAVSKWENDQSCPDITMLPKLAGIFHCTTDELLGIAPKEIPVQENAVPETGREIPAEKSSGIRWNALSSPVAVFGCWLFLTGLVYLADSLLPYPISLVDTGYRCNLADIAIACGIFAFGLCSLFHRFSLLRLACACFGGICVWNLITLPGITDVDWRIPLSVGLSLFGLDLLLDTLTGRKPAVPNGHMVPACMSNRFDCEADSFVCTISFGDGNRQVTLPCLSHGRAEVSFGDLTLDLTGCLSFSEKCQLDLHSSFGEMTVLLPRSCRAEVNVHTRFASCTTFGTPESEPPFQIYVNGTAGFGHMTLRYI